MSATEAAGLADGSDAPGREVVLDVRDLRVTFRQRGRVVRAVDGLSYQLRAGTSMAIVGESGSGKTVSTRALMGLLPETAHVSGSAVFAGENLFELSEKQLRRHLGPDLAMVFQDPSRSLNPTMRVGTQIVESIRAHVATSRAEAKQRAVELLRRVRIPLAEQRAQEYPHQLSGGMRQRVMIAMALARSPKVLIADEATTALDVTTQAQIMALLRDLQVELDMALILISHDLGLAATFTDDILVMYAGRVAERAPTSTLFESVRMPYTSALLDAIPRLERESHSIFPVVGGSAANPGDLGASCAFNPRCPYAEVDCRTSQPALIEHEPGHFWACFHPLAARGFDL